MKLDRKKVIIGIIIIAAVIIIGLLYYFLMNQEGDTVEERARNLFPFGTVSTPVRPGGQSTVDTDNDGIQDTIDTDLPEIDIPRLRRISDFPTGGFIPLIRTEKKEVKEEEIDEDGSVISTFFRTTEVQNQYVRYSAIEDATIFETMVTPSTLAQETLVDNYIPNAERAFFNSDGTRALFQYWNTESRLPETYLSKIEKIVLTVKPCPYDFAPIKIDDDDVRILGIHEFLNKNPQTRVARTGINSPGNESSLVVEATITAIKNFQSLYQISIDGEIGAATREKMNEVCNDYQQQEARARFDALSRKYTLSGFFLPQNLISTNFNPKGDELFYLQKDPKGAIGILRNLVNETKETIFESTFGEWTSGWKTPSKIEITTKPSFAADGYSYSLDPRTGRYFKSIAEKKALSTLASPNGEKLLIFEIKNDKLELGIYSVSNKRSRALNIISFTDKCTWGNESTYLYCAVPDALSSGEKYPDTWYQGLEKYNDSLWRINTNTFEETLLTNISVDYQESLDVSSIMVDPRSEYLYFLDKGTEYLWSYRLVDF